MSVANQGDLARDEILDRYQVRIDQGDRTKLTREEKDNLALLLVDRLVELNHQGKDDQAAIRELCEAEKALLERGYPKGSINSAYLPNYTRLLKEAIVVGRLELTELNSYPKPWTKRDGSESGVTQTHYALGYLTYDGATQAQLRNETTAKNNQRQDDLKPVQVDAYLRQVQELLESEEPEILTIAIAALTGRRHAEVVSVGKFEETKHPYQLRFEGQQKKAEAEAFEIVSLIPARDLLPVFDRFRALPTMQALVGLDDDHPEVQAFNSRVNRRVQALFETTGLVPVLEGFKSVSIHRLRALYGAIAVHFFCANNQHLHRFLQNHLGHVLTKEVGATNSRATDHYFHYFLVNENGKPITARGIKLMAHGSLVEAVTEVETVAVEKAEPVEAEMPVMTEVIEQVAPKELTPVEAQVEAQVEAPALGKKLREGKLRIHATDLDRWNHLLASRFPDRVTQAERMTALLEWAETNLPESPQATQAEPELIAPSQAEAIQATLDAVMERLAKLEGERATALAPKPQRTKAVRSETTDDPTAPKVGRAAGRANGILLAVQDWNRQHPDQSFAVTLSLLKDEFGINFRAARDFLEERQNEIWELHQASGVENPRSHNRQQGRNVGELKEFVRNFVGQG